MLFIRGRTSEKFGVRFLLSEPIKIIFKKYKKNVDAIIEGCRLALWTAQPPSIKI